MTDLTEKDFFLRSIDELIEIGFVDTDFNLTDKYWELFFKYKGIYILESIVYPILIEMKGNIKKDKEYDYYNTLLNLVLNEKPEYLESVETERKYVERRINDDEYNI